MRVLDMLEERGKLSRKPAPLQAASA